MYFLYRVIHKWRNPLKEIWDEKLQKNICDVIQQKVHKVGKLVFPNAVEISRGDGKEHLKKKTKKKKVNWCMWSLVITF